MSERDKRNIWLLSIVFGVTLLSISASGNLSKRLIWNASPSVPIGLYWIKNDELRIGDIVLTELPLEAKILADQRGYLPKNIPALKRVRGVYGDFVCRFKRAVLINGKAVSVAQLHDNLGLKLPEWNGCRRLSSDEFFLLSDHPKSFDGRYLDLSIATLYLELPFRFGRTDLWAVWIWMAGEGLRVEKRDGKIKFRHSAGVSNCVRLGF